MTKVETTILKFQVSYRFSHQSNDSYKDRVRIIHRRLLLTWLEILMQNAY